MLVAHALGGIDHTPYTNSEEAFLRSWQAGFRWFEVDLATTADGRMVCFHENLERRVGLNRSISAVGVDEFLSGQFADRYTLMTFERLLRLAVERPGAVLVTDTKRLTGTIMAKLNQEIDAVDPAMRSRVVIQMYHPEDLPLIRKSEQRHGAFGAIIFTLYQSEITDRELLEFVDRSGIRLVTVTTRRFNRELAAELHERQVKILVHTLNERQQLKAFRIAGIDGSYTDFLTPDVAP